MRFEKRRTGEYGPRPGARDRAAGVCPASVWWAVADKCGNDGAAIELSLPWPARWMGRRCACGSAAHLESLAFGVAEVPGMFLVTVRVGGPRDIATRTIWWKGRAHGWLRFDAPQAPGARCRTARKSGAPLQHDVRSLFVDNGFTEVYNYSFLGENRYARSVRSGGPHARPQSDRQQSGIDARVAAAGTGRTSPTTPGTARASACSKSARRSRAAGGLPAPGCGAVTGRTAASSN